MHAEVQPTGYRYVVQVQLFENRGQGARADLSCHWAVNDTVVSDIFTNVRFDYFPAREH